jgi:sugar lactone lactonase YvrE
MQSPINPSWRSLGCPILLTLAAALLSGCASTATQTASPTQTTTSTSTGTDSTPSNVSGRVHAGQQIISGSNIYVFAAGNSGYSGPSVSLIDPAHAGVGTDTYGAYVTADSNGNFLLTGTYHCSPGQQVYVLARGGALPSGTYNSAISLIAALGACPSSGTFATVLPSLVINEVTTVAAVYALSGFMTDATHLSSSGTSLAQQDLANAFLTLYNLVDVTKGDVPALSVVSNAAPPQATLHTLANILAACVTSAGLSSSACTTLFSSAKDLSGNLPTDTATAALNITHNPGANVSALYNLSTGTKIFSPTLTAAPNDWTIAITFYGDGLAGPYYPAFDASGNLWVPDYANNTVTEFDPRGIPLSGFTGFSGNNLDQPFYVAIDSGQNAWVANYAYGNPANVSRFLPNGYANGSFSCGTNCTAVAVDTYQNIWVAANSGITTLHNSGLALSQFATTAFAPGLALDSTGRGWSLGLTRNLYRLTLSTAVAQYPEAVTSTLSGDLNLFAVDSSDNIWFTSGKNNALGRVDSSGNLVSPATGYTGGGLSYPAQLAIDGSNRVWVANRDGNSISAFSNSGSPISPTTGYKPSGQVAPESTIDPSVVGVHSPHGLAIDGAGNVWVTNFTANSVTEFVGLATPVVTPISPTTHGRRP